jgi:hypothetical protein
MEQHKNDYTKLSPFLQLQIGSFSLAVRKEAVLIQAAVSVCSELLATASWQAV